MGRLDGKVALITGGCSGLGECTARLFAENGAKIAIADLNETKAAEMLADFEKAGVEAFFVKVNIGNSDDCKKMVERTYEKFGKLDVLFNNVGMSGDLNPDVGHLPESQVEDVLNINYKGVWRGIHYAVPYMVKNGGGSIISTASVAGVCGNMGGSVYGPSKAAVINLTQTAAYELAQHNIRVNCVSPYTMATPMMDFMLKGENGKKMLEFYAGDNMFYRLVKPIEVANAVLFLASDESSGISGQNLIVDLGFTVKGFSYIKEVFEEANIYE